MDILRRCIIVYLFFITFFRNILIAQVISNRTMFLFFAVRYRCLTVNDLVLHYVNIEIGRFPAFYLRKLGSPCYQCSCCAGQCFPGIIKSLDNTTWEKWRHYHQFMKVFGKQPVWSHIITTGPNTKWKDLAFSKPIFRIEAYFRYILNQIV